MNPVIGDFYIEHLVTNQRYTIAAVDFYLKKISVLQHFWKFGYLRFVSNIEKRNKMRQRNAARKLYPKFNTNGGK